MHYIHPIGRYPLVSLHVHTAIFTHCVYTHVGTSCFLWSFQEVYTMLQWLFTITNGAIQQKHFYECQFSKIFRPHVYVTPLVYHKRNTKPTFLLLNLNYHACLKVMRSGCELGATAPWGEMAPNNARLNRLKRKSILNTGCAGILTQTLRNM